MNKETYTLYDSTTIPSYEERLGWCPQMANASASDGLDDIMADPRDMDWQTLDYMLSKYKNNPCVVFGYELSANQESKDIDPIKTKSLADAVRLCFSKHDDAVVIQKWGHLEVSVYKINLVQHYQV